MDAAVFTHVALVTSLGHDAATTAAAARAGIVRASTLPYLVDNVETKEPEPVTGHAVSGQTTSFAPPSAASSVSSKRRSRACITFSWSHFTSWLHPV